MGRLSRFLRSLSGPRTQGVDTGVKVVMGLGNPGDRYETTRHNVGWWVVDQVAEEWKVGGFVQDGPALVVRVEVNDEEVLLAKPTTYMNRSGQAVEAVRRAHPGLDLSRDLLVVVDDASLDAGRVRIRRRGSPGGHRGLESISSVLGSDEYPRLRVGVGRPPPGADLSEWVLSTMPPEDKAEVMRALPELAEAVRVWLEEGIETAMNRFNR